VIFSPDLGADLAEKRFYTLWADFRLSLLSAAGFI
jgi:hypothetical protein